MIWHTPPELSGQTIEASYASNGELGYKKVFDKSDLTQKLYCTKLSSCGCPDECNCWQP